MFFVFLLLLRFHFQWLRVPFRNAVGEFVLRDHKLDGDAGAARDPGLAGLDLATLLLAWIVQALGLWIEAGIRGAGARRDRPGARSRWSISALQPVHPRGRGDHRSGVLMDQSRTRRWRPVLAALTRPFLRPLRRFVPPIGNFDLTPLVLVVAAQVVLIVLWHLRAAVASL